MSRALYDGESALEPLAYLRNIYRLLMQLGLQNKVNIDLGLVHRGNYYTGTVFRGYIEGSGITVLSGGRYDGLLGEFGCPLPATGFGVEVDALAPLCARGATRPSRRRLMCWCLVSTAARCGRSPMRAP